MGELHFADERRNAARGQKLFSYACFVLIYANRRSGQSIALTEIFSNLSFYSQLDK